MGIFRQGPGVFFLFVALVLLILVSVGVPIANWLYFLEANVGGQRVRFGQWGWCQSNSGSDDFQCVNSRLGYNANDVVNAIGGDTGDISSAVIKGLTYALILHPISAAIALIAILVSLTTNVCLDICGSFISFFAFLVCLVALICDSVLFITARSRINDVANSSASLSNAYWLVVAATISLLLASLTVCLGSARARRAKRNRQSAAYAAPTPVTTEKRHFWNRS